MKQASKGRSRIRRYAMVAAAALAALWLIEYVASVAAVRGETKVTHAGGLSLSSILGPVGLDDIGRLGPDFDVTSGDAVLLRGGNRLYAVEAGRHDLSDLGLPEPPESFALDNADVMLTVSDGFLGTLSEDGKPLAGVPLPYPGARLVRSVHSDSVYLYGGKGGDFRLYRFLEDGTLQVLLRANEPIVAAADTANGVFAATATKIVRVGWPQAILLFKAPEEPGWGPIVSLAAAEDGLVFFSTPTRIFALKGGTALSVVNDSGGALRRRGDRLYVLDGRRRLLYALSPASLTLFGSATR
jgi:hypothetical protein